MRFVYEMKKINLCMEMQNWFPQPQYQISHI